MGRASRERARGLLTKALYQWQLAGHSRDELLEQYAELAEFGRIDQAYFRDLLDHVIENADAFDAVIAEYAARGIGQLDAIGRGILLLAMAELRFRDDIEDAISLMEKALAVLQKEQLYPDVQTVLLEEIATLRAYERPDEVSIRTELLAMADRVAELDIKSNTAMQADIASDVESEEWLTLVRDSLRVSSRAENRYTAHPSLLAHPLLGAGVVAGPGAPSAGNHQATRRVPSAETTRSTVALNGASSMS